MENTEKERFESVWNDFIILVKGKLISTAQKQKLSTPLAKLILIDAAGTWGEEYSRQGRWLQQLAQSESSKAELVKDILLRDMQFMEVEQTSSPSDYYNYIVPSVTACAGYGVSKLLGLGVIASSSLVIIPTLLSFPALKLYRKTRTDVIVNHAIDLYMNQLEKYKNSVLSILS